MHSFRHLMLVLVVTALLAVGSNPAHAGTGDIGFIVNDEFSSFLSVDGEVVFDFFAPLLELPGFAGFVNTNSQFLQQTGFFDFVPPDLGIALLAISYDGFITGDYELVYSPDPFILYKLDATNTTNVVREVVLSILPPIVPVAGECNVTSEIQVELIDANNDGIASLTIPNPELQGFFLIDENGLFEDSGAGTGDGLASAGNATIGVPETAGPQSVSGWQFMAADVVFRLSPGDRVIIHGMVGVGNPGTFFPNIDGVDFDAFSNLEDCLADGFDDDGDGVPNGCDACPGQDDQADGDGGGQADCLANPAPADDGNNDDNNDGSIDDNNDGDNGENGGNVPPVVAPVCAFGTINLLPLTALGIVALRGRRRPLC